MIENRIEKANEQFASVVKIFLGIGGRDGESRKGLVQHGYDVLLFGQRGERNFNI